MRVSFKRAEGVTYPEDLADNAAQSREERKVVRDVHAHER